MPIFLTLQYQQYPGQLTCLAESTCPIDDLAHKSNFGKCCIANKNSYNHWIWPFLLYKNIFWEKCSCTNHYCSITKKSVWVVHKQGANLDLAEQDHQWWLTLATYIFLWIMTTYDFIGKDNLWLWVTTTSHYFYEIRQLGHYFLWIWKTYSLWDKKT